MKSRANTMSNGYGFLQQQPIHAAEVLDFFDDLGVFADLDLEVESTADGLLYTEASSAITGGDGDRGTKQIVTSTPPPPQFQSFSALLDSELQLTDDFDIGGGLGAMEPLLPMHLHESDFSAMNVDAGASSSSLTLEHELLYLTSDYDSDPASSIASEPAPVAAEEVARPKKKKKKKSTSQRQKEELSYLRGKLFEYENELKRIAIENEKNVVGTVGAAATGATNSTAANGEVEGALTASVKALSLWETMAKNQLEEKNRAEMENAALRQKMEAQLKFAKSLERMLRKRRIWDGIHEPSQQRFITLSVKDSESFESLRNSIEARAQTVDDVFHAQGLTELSPPKRDANIAFVNESGIRIDFIHSTTVPFQADTVSNIVWEYLQKRELKLSEVKLTTQVVEQSEDFIIITQCVTSNLPSDIRNTTVHSAFKRIHYDHRIVIVWESITECKASATRGIPAAQLLTKGCGQIIRQVDPHGGPKSAILQSYVTVVPTLGQPEASSGPRPSHDNAPSSLDTGLLTELTISAYEQNAQTVRQAIENALFDKLLRSA